VACDGKMAAKFETSKNRVFTAAHSDRRELLSSSASLGKKLLLAYLISLTMGGGGLGQITISDLLIMAACSPRSLGRE
jgi:hypothetical protein